MGFHGSLRNFVGLSNLSYTELYLSWFRHHTLGASAWAVFEVKHKGRYAPVGCQKNDCFYHLENIWESYGTTINYGV